MTQFNKNILRPDIPDAEAFSVTEINYAAKLDQNESPQEISSALKEALAAELVESAWRRYPQPKQYNEIKAAFAKQIGQAPEKVILTIGGDQIILLAYLAAGGPGRTARFFEPTYPMIPSFARVTQTTAQPMVLGADFPIDDQLPGAKTDLTILVSPNNPTGNAPSREKVQQTLALGGMVLLDEAYAEYAGTSMIDLTDHYANLLVGRSLSKSMLAGVRLGYGVGHPSLIQVLERLIFAPYHLNALQLVVAKNYHKIQAERLPMIELVVAERVRLQRLISQFGCQTWPSQGNFVLFAHPEASRIYDHLIAEKIRIRNVSGLPGLSHHLRVTVGSPTDNDLFLGALAQALRGTSG